MEVQDYNYLPLNALEYGIKLLLCLFMYLEHGLYFLEIKT